MSKFKNFREIEVDKIEVSPFQSRKVFDQESMSGLMLSIYEVGVLEPLIVRETQDDNYELIDGDRRLRAAKEAHLEHVPCIIRESSDDDVVLEQLIANCQREDLNIVEKSDAIHKSLEKIGTQQKLAQLSGLSKQSISAYEEAFDFLSKIGSKNIDVSILSNVGIFDIHSTIGLEVPLRLRVIQEKINGNIHSDDMQSVVRALKIAPETDKDSFLKNPSTQLIKELVDSGRSLTGTMKDRTEFDIQEPKESNPWDRLISDVRLAGNIICGIDSDFVKIQTSDRKNELLLILRQIAHKLSAMGALPRE